MKLTKAGKEWKKLTKHIKPVDGRIRILIEVREKDRSISIKGAKVGSADIIHAMESLADAGELFVDCGSCSGKFDKCKKNNKGK